MESLEEPLKLPGPWTVRFPSGLGAPETIRLDELLSWTEHADPGVRHFSGTARYETSVELSPDWLKAGRRVYLDLGSLWAVGEAWLNEKPLGVVWKPPYLVDVTAAARAGENRLVVEVANTWSNRLVGDAALPKAERLTRTNVLHNNGQLWKNVALLPSGLFGPVRLVPAQEISMQLPDEPAGHTEKTP